MRARAACFALVFGMTIAACGGRELVTEPSPEDAGTPTTASAQTTAACVASTCTSLSGAPAGIACDEVATSGTGYAIYYAGLNPDGSIAPDCVCNEDSAGMLSGCALAPQPDCVSQTTCGECSATRGCAWCPGFCTLVGLTSYCDAGSSVCSP